MQEVVETEGDVMTHLCMHVQYIRIKSCHKYLHMHTQKKKVKSTTQRPTNLKWGRSERVSWGEAEEKSTVTVTLLQRRDKR